VETIYASIRRDITIPLKKESQKFFIFKGLLWDYLGTVYIQLY